jgi:hypothetical protein
MTQAFLSGRKLLSSAVSGWEFVVSFCCGRVKVYRPEVHYMRGPGPKWREKHAFDAPLRPFLGPQVR